MFCSPLLCFPPSDGCCPTWPWGFGVPAFLKCEILKRYRFFYSYSALLFVIFFLILFIIIDKCSPPACQSSITWFYVRSLFLRVFKVHKLHIRRLARSATGGSLHRSTRIAKAQRWYLGEETHDYARKLISSKCLNLPSTTTAFSHVYLLYQNNSGFYRFEVWSGRRLPRQGTWRATCKVQINRTGRLEASNNRLKTCDTGSLPRWEAYINSTYQFAALVSAFWALVENRIWT